MKDPIRQANRAIQMDDLGKVAEAVANPSTRDIAKQRTRTALLIVAAPLLMLFAAAFLMFYGSDQEAQYREDNAHILRMAYGTMSRELYTVEGDEFRFPYAPVCELDDPADFNDTKYYYNPDTGEIYCSHIYTQPKDYTPPATIASIALFFISFAAIIAGVYINARLHPDWNVSLNDLAPLLDGAYGYVLHQGGVYRVTRRDSGQKDLFTQAYAEQIVADILSGRDMHTDNPVLWIRGLRKIKFLETIDELRVRATRLNPAGSNSPRTQGRAIGFKLHILHNDPQYDQVLAALDRL